MRVWKLALSQYFISTLLRSPSMGKFSFVTEYEDEEEFKQSIVDRINNCVPITDIFIKEVPDDYDMKHKILIKL